MKFFKINAVRIVIFSAFLLVLSGCTSTTSFFSFGTSCVVPLTKEEVKDFNAESGAKEIWVRQEDAVTIRVITPPNLNQMGRYSHGTTIGIYQMNSPEKFVKEIATQSGLRRLLLAQDLGDSILQYDVRPLQPRSSIRFDLARAEKARYIAVVVGYYSLITDRSVRLIKIPSVRKTRSKLNPVNWVTPLPKPSPAELDVLVALGNSQIDDMVVNVRGECEQN